MKKLFLFILVAFSALLCACQTTSPDPVIVTKVIVPSDDLLVDCDLQAPPDRDAFVAADSTKQKAMMADAYNGATSKGIMCNKRWAGLRRWKEQQLKLYEQNKPASTAASP